MQKTNTWYRIYILGFQIVLLLFMGQDALANKKNKQGIPNMYNHDEKPYYFGLAFSYNTSRYRIARSEYFLDYDSVMLIDPVNSPGIGVGLVSCLQFNKYWDLRFIPTISFSDRVMNYVNNYGQNANQVQQYKVSAVLFHLPLSIKLKSDRINNFRFYGMTGLKFDWDMGSNKNSSNRNEVIRVKNTDYGYEIGGGMNFYFSNFILSPEVKVSRGLNNLLIRETSSQISQSLEFVKSSFLQFTIYLES